MKTLILEIEDKDWEIMEALCVTFNCAEPQLIQLGLNYLKETHDVAKSVKKLNSLTHV
jgi:hypothetical protein